MENRWTGGQYSLVRGVTGVFLAFHGHPALIVPALAFALGWFDRVAALLLAVALVAGGEPAFAALLGLHVLVGTAPYGSVRARGRLDPGGGWALHPRVYAAFWVLLAMTHVTPGPAFAPVLVAALFFGVARGVPGARPWIWTASFAFHVMAVQTLDAAALLVHLFAFDPGWIPGTRPAGREVVFYDGTCGLCHGFVRFLISEHREPDTLALAPLQSEAGAKLGDVPDSIVVRTADGRVLVRSTAALHLLLRVGGYWRVIGRLGLLVPRFLRDFAYDRIAKVRHRIFKRPEETCPILPPHLRKQFLDA